VKALGRAPAIDGAPVFTAGVADIRIPAIHDAAVNLSAIHGAVGSTTTSAISIMAKGIFISTGGHGDQEHQQKWKESHGVNLSRRQADDNCTIVPLDALIIFE